MAVVQVQTKDFRWIVLEVLIQTIIYLVINFAGGIGRGKYFTKELMSQFQSEFGVDEPPAGGAPDCGTGRFSSKLRFKDWLDYNTTQYLAGNCLQTHVGGVLLTVALGIYAPTLGIIFGAFLILFRIGLQVTAKSNPSTLTFLEPLSHAVVLVGLSIGALLAYRQS